MNYMMMSILNFSLTTLCFIGMYCFHKYVFGGDHNTYFIAAFGAAATLVFSNEHPKSYFKKICMAAIVAAFIGVSLHQIALDAMFKIPLAIGGWILIMNLTQLNHLPAGAIVLIPLFPSMEIQELGYLFILYPTLTGLIIIYFFSKIKQHLIHQYYGK